MNNLMNFDQLSMSTKEIADLCEQRHDNVVAKVLELNQKGVLLNFRETKRTIKHAGGGRPMDVYDLTKRDTLLIISGYKDNIRARVIDRWIQLESEREMPEFTDPTLGALVKSLVELDQVKRQQAELINKTIQVEQKTNVLEHRVEQVEIQHRGGVPNGYISKKNAYHMYSQGLSEGIFHMALDILGVTKKNYVHHTDDGFGVRTFAYKDVDLEEAISLFIEDAEQVSPHMCESQILKGKRFRFIKHQETVT